jgi:hypothetical protein
MSSTGFRDVVLRPSYEVGVPVMQTLMVAGIIFGLVASAAWTAFLSFELFHLIGLMF